ncbi:MAG: hypothetical protein RMJ48_16785 [Roseiflexaceae bacterium]|nr:hypothetical protein [Roseiflexaceae bacterium]
MKNASDFDCGDGYQAQVTVLPAPSKDTRSVAYTEGERAKAYYRPHSTIDMEDRERALVVASHKPARYPQAQHDGDDAQKRADIVLPEGLAIWIHLRRLAQ